MNLSSWQHVRKPVCIAQEYVRFLRHPRFWLKNILWDLILCHCGCRSFSWHLGTTWDLLSFLKVKNQSTLRTPIISPRQTTYCTNYIVYIILNWSDTLCNIWVCLKKLKMGFFFFTHRVLSIHPWNIYNTTYWPESRKRTVTYSRIMKVENHRIIE